MESAAKKNQPEPFEIANPEARPSERALRMMGELLAQLALREAREELARKKVDSAA